MTKTKSKTKKPEQTKCHLLKEEYALEILIPRVLGYFWEWGCESNGAEGCIDGPQTESGFEFFAQPVNAPGEKSWLITNEHCDYLHFLLWGDHKPRILHFERGEWEDELLAELENNQPRSVERFAAEGLVSPNSSGHEMTIAARKHWEKVRAGKKAA